MIRSRVKTGIAAALGHCGVAGWIGSVTGARRLPLVIGYHRVVEDFQRRSQGYMPSMLISTEVLERHLDWLGRHYEFIGADDVAVALEGRGSSRRPAALITFDDGYRDVYEQAYPLLKRKGIPAIVFVVTDLVGTDSLLVHDALYLLMRRRLASGTGDPPWWSLFEAAGVEPFEIHPDKGVAADPLRMTRLLLEHVPQNRLHAVIAELGRHIELQEEETGGLHAMDWGMLMEMQRAGIEVGSHTCGHAFLTSESPETSADEARRSRLTLMQRLGGRGEHFAYPDGRFNRRIVQAVAEAGYRFAYSTCRHRDTWRPELTIPRRLLWEHSCVDALGRFSPVVMDCQVNGVFDLVARCGVDHAA